MATTSAKVTILDPATGQITIVDEDADIFGTGTISSRPATGSGIGDMYVVNDPGLSIYRIDLWDGATWQSLSGAGVSNINTGNTLWVDAVFGNDGTAVADRQDLPWATILSALSAAAAGDCVLVRPGVYTESPLTVPSGVALISTGNWRTTTINGAAATGTRVTLSSGSMIQGFTVQIPTNNGAYAVEYAGATGVASAMFISFNGQPGALGGGLANTGAGKIIALEVRYLTGDCDAIIEVTQGILAVEGVHVPGSAGAVNAGVRNTGGRFQGVDVNMGAPSVVNGIEVDAGITLVFGPNLFNVTNGIHITGNGPTAEFYGGKIEGSQLSVLVDPGLTLANAVIKITTQLEPLFSFPPAAAASDFATSFIQSNSPTREAAQRLLGVNFELGFPERGSAFRAGEGGPYSDGYAVQTSTGATAGTDGGAITDITSAASTKSGSTFQFPTAVAGDVIMWCSQRLDPTSASIKHFSVEIRQDTAGVGGEYIWEIWDGAAWVEVGVQAVSTDLNYRYSNEVFIRANREQIRLGIFDSTTWATKTIGAYTGYWGRVRVTVAPTTAPIFEQLQITPSNTFISSAGIRSAHGLALWRSTLLATGNIFGESGGVANSSVPVGTGGLPTGWNHIGKNNALNGNGDAIYTQFALPAGICTAYPLRFEILYTVTGSQPITLAPTMILSVLPQEVSGVLVADPAGGVVPVLRDFTNTDALTANPGLSQSKTLVPAGATIPATYDNQIHCVTFDGFDISSYYAQDLIIVRVELDDDGTPNQDVVVWSVNIEGVAYTDGREL